VQKPLAVVIIGGLVSATLLTLMVLPALYFLLEQRAARVAQSEDEQAVRSGIDPLAPQAAFEE